MFPLALPGVRTVGGALLQTSARVLLAGAAQLATSLFVLPPVATAAFASPQMFVSVLILTLDNVRPALNVGLIHVAILSLACTVVDCGTAPNGDSCCWLDLGSYWT